MKPQKIYLALLVAPWLSIPFLGMKVFRRFFPAALFICLVVVGETIVARKRVWWWFYKKLNKNLIGEAPLIAGPFLVGSQWILKFTYGKFLTYLAANLLVDSFFVYVVINWFKQIGYAALVRLQKGQLLMIFLFKALLLYAFQFIKEKRDAPSKTL
ncbi:hypothetical protein J7E71_13790 [Mesobacillus foraminis]|uniref:hypothetical protein n=1 Tax=Mesobacillus foraminis TaxID=279826 RepID=UPI001BE82ED8|nr:hypothetical protein [Mesobacillus foraminis]MBT2757015.1 hypothetical protein [Mesobacillus foraminis]